MKIMNPEWEKIEVTPIDIKIRDEIGKSLDTKDVSKTGDVVKELLGNSGKYHDKITRILNEYVYNIGSCAKIGGDYIISAANNEQ
jgi:YidC/Oxa1 family membrane protein insertase